MKKKFNTFLLLCISLASYSQVTGVDFPHLIPTSPSVAALDKFGNYPIGYNTGTVGISVPLYNFSLGKGLDLNISLDYHSSGIKVNELEGVAGLGWALSAGGYISREIRGISDEESHSGFYDYITAHKGLDFIEDPLRMATPAFMDSISNGDLDSEPDLFSLDLLGRRYKFFLGNDREFHTIPYSNIQFRNHPLSNALGKGAWDIIDEAGTHYAFNVNESTEESTGRLPYPVAWKLTQITSAEGQILATFDYSHSYETRSDLIQRTQAFAVFGYNDADESFRDLALEPKETKPQYAFYGQALSKITIPGTGSLTFIPNFELRKRLISVEYKTLRGEKKETFNLYYDSLYLSRITRTNGSDSETNYRTFTYYDQLPGRGSCSQDFWGYYNGKANRSLFPELGDMGKDPAPNHQYEGANRHPTSSAKAGTLKEITYPSGGKTLFEFENNKIRAEGSNTTIKEVFQSYIREDGVGEKSSTPFTMIKENMKVRMVISIHPVSKYSLSIRLVRTDDNRTIFSINDTQIQSGSRTEFPFLGTNPDGTDRYEYVGNYVLSAGTYQWVTLIEGFRVTPPSGAISMSYSYFQNVVTETSEKMVGGLRIFGITNYDKNGTVTERFRYTYLDKEGKCSGLGAPEPQFIKSYVLSSPSTIIFSGSYLGVEEIGEADLTRYTGSAVQYTNVTEEKINGTLPVLKTEYEYYPRYFKRFISPTNIDDRGYNPVPYDPNEYSEGLLKSKTDYKYENGTYTPIRKEDNIHMIEEGESSVPTFRAYSVTKYYLNPLLEVPISLSNKIKCGSYQLKSAKVYLSSKRIEDYSGSSPVTTTIKYSYDNSFYLQPTSVTVTKSGGKTTQTTYRYSFDETSSLYNAMKIKNMINMPITITTTTNNMRTDQTNIQYGYFNNNSVIAPSVAHKQTGLSSLYDETVYDRYDNYGNPLHISHNALNSTFYIWAYKGKYPIAEIKGGNYTFDQIEAAVKDIFAVDGINALSEMESPNESKLKDGSLQNALPGALVTTYTYSPRGGILTMTAPNSVVSSYEYDNLERPIRNYINNKTVQSYDYHYQNQ